MENKFTTIMSHTDRSVQDQMMSDPHPIEVQTLSAEEVRLITLYRKAGDRARSVAISTLEGFASTSDQLEEGETRSERPHGQTK